MSLESGGSRAGPRFRGDVAEGTVPGLMLRVGLVGVASTRSNTIQAWVLIDPGFEFQIEASSRGYLLPVPRRWTAIHLTR